MKRAVHLLPGFEDEVLFLRAVEIIAGCPVERLLELRVSHLEGTAKLLPLPFEQKTQVTEGGEGPSSPDERLTIESVEIQSEQEVLEDVLVSELAADVSQARIRSGRASSRRPSSSRLESTAHAVAHQSSLGASLLSQLQLGHDLAGPAKQVSLSHSEFTRFKLLHAHRA
jgi:hypothetical protein